MKATLRPLPIVKVLVPPRPLAEGKRPESFYAPDDKYRRIKSVFKFRDEVEPQNGNKINVKKKNSILNRPRIKTEAGNSGSYLIQMNGKIFKVIDNDQEALRMKRREELYNSEMKSIIDSHKNWEQVGKSR